MQYLGCISWGFALATAPFHYSSELEGTNTDLQKLFLPRSPLKAFCAAAVFLYRGPTEAAREVGWSSGPWWGQGPRAWRQTPVELGTSRQFSICGPVGWPSSFPLGGLVLPCSVVVLTSTPVLPTDGANCRVPILGDTFHCRCEWTQTQQAQYNEFGREAGLRTGPLWGLHRQSGRIVGELDRQQHGWGKGQSSSSGLGQGWFLILLLWYCVTRAF